MIEIAAIVALLVVGALVARSWLAARGAAAQLSATIASQKQLLDQAAAREKQRDATLAQTLTDIQRAKAAVKTPAQAAAQILRVLPTLPAPISLTMPPAPAADGSVAVPASAARPLARAGRNSDPAAQCSSATAAPAPSSAQTLNHDGVDSNSPPPATATIPQVDLPPIYDYIEDCRACQAKLAAAQADLSDERAKEMALTKEREAAMKAQHGGGFWARFKAAAKYLLVGGAVGAIVAATAVAR